LGFGGLRCAVMAYLCHKYYVNRAQSVYRWTEQLYPHRFQPILPIHQAEEIIKHVCLAYSKDIPKLITGYHSRTNGKIIELPHQARTLPIILHELAHVIVMENDDDPHGTNFMKIISELYVAFLPRSREEIYAEARIFGLI